MKNLTLFLAVLLCGLGVLVFAEDGLEMPTPLFDWSLLWSGLWDGKSLTSGNLHNREEIKLDFLPPGLTLRGQVLDRRPLNFEIESQDAARAVTHFQGGLYHKQTDSRLLFGVLDEWGLSARIRNPWIRSPPYAVNYKPMIADLKTAVSSTKNEELYLYLSTPPLKSISGFVSVQTEVLSESGKYGQTAVAAGVDFDLPNKSSLSIETFYTWALLKPKSANSWFSNPPALPERDFNLYAAGVLFDSPLLSISSDFALSETFAWGTDIYANLGISVSPLVLWSTARMSRPLTISLAADGSGKRFTARDGANLSSAFRTAARIELKRPYNSLFRFSTVLRGPDIISMPSAKGFTRSSTNFYYRFPSPRSDDSLIKLSRVSISIDRNADNHLKITDRLYGYIGVSLDLSQFGLNTPIGVLFSGSVRGITVSEEAVYAYPIPAQPWDFENCVFYGEISFFPSKYQFKARFGYEKNSKNDEIWDFSISGAMRFKKGRLSLKLTSSRLPDLWNFNISWRLEVK